MLWHFTSLAAARKIDAGGGVLHTGTVMLARRGLPPLSEGSRYVWLIDEPNPSAVMLGFRDDTRHMAARYRVRDEALALWWPKVRRRHSRAYLDVLESFAMPTLWWVVEGSVPVTRDRDWTDPIRWQGQRNDARNDRDTGRAEQRRR